MDQKNKEKFVELINKNSPFKARKYTDGCVLVVYPDNDSARFSHLDKNDYLEDIFHEWNYQDREPCYECCGGCFLELDELRVPYETYQEWKDAGFLKPEE